MMRRDTRVILGLGLAAGLVGGALFTALLAGGPVVAQESSVPPSGPAPKVLSAEEFRLVDRHGQTRALLAFSEGGQPYLQFRDEFDVYRVWVGISDETGLAVRDVDGKTRIVLSVEPDGDPSLVLRDRQQKTRSVHP